MDLLTMRRPTPRQLSAVVCVRVASVASTRTGENRVWTNTLYRASIAYSAAASSGDDVLSASSRSAKLLFGQNPGVKAGDLILVPPVLAADPPDPVPGTLWIDQGLRSVRSYNGSAIITLITVAGLYTTPLDLFGPGLADLGGGLGIVLVVVGPAANSAHLGLQYRVDATEPM